MVRTKYVAAGILGFMVILGWNAFLIKRDQAMFQSAHERACQRVKTFHPDCQVAR